MIKRSLLAVILFNCMVAVLIAGEAVDPTLLNPILADSVRSSVIFKVDLEDLEYYSLNRTDVNTPIPLADVSRQFMAPGHYRLTYEKLGYRILNQDFTLGVDQEIEINHKPNPVSPQLLLVAANKKHSTRNNLLYSLGFLAVSGALKYLGDQAYKDYQNETDPNTIAELRKTTQSYEYSCLTSAGVSAVYMGLSLKSFWALRGAKNDIRNAMRR
jgi:hypothetical protein